MSARNAQHHASAPLNIGDTPQRLPAREDIHDSRHGAVALAPRHVPDRHAHLAGPRAPAPQQHPELRPPQATPRGGRSRRRWGRSRGGHAAGKSRRRRGRYGANPGREQATNQFGQPRAVARPLHQPRRRGPPTPRSGRRQRQRGSRGARRRLPVGAAGPRRARRPARRLSVLDRRGRPRRPSAVSALRGPSGPLPPLARSVRRPARLAPAPAVVPGTRAMPARRKVSNTHPGHASRRDRHQRHSRYVPRARRRGTELARLAVVAPRPLCVGGLGRRAFVFAGAGQEARGGAQAG